jgi:hypothetical protein
MVSAAGAGVFGVVMGAAVALAVKLARPIVAALAR